MMLFFDAIQEFLGQDGNQTIDSGDKVGHKLFLGGMSLQREPGGDRLGIVDGQQRMNAIVAFSAAARDVLFEQEDFESAMAIQKDIVGTNELLFQSSSDLIELFKQLHRPMVMLGLNSTNAQDKDGGIKWSMDLEHGEWLLAGDKVLNHNGISGKIESIENNTATVVFEEVVEIGETVTYCGPTKSSLTDHPIHWGYRYFGTKLALIFDDIELGVTNSQSVTIKKSGKSGSLHFNMEDEKNQYKWFFFKDLQHKFEYNGNPFSATFGDDFKFIPKKKLSGNKNQERRGL